MSIELVMPSKYLLLCCPLLLLDSILPSIRTFLNESVVHIRWPKYWSFTFSISPFNEYSGLISFRVDWLDLLAVQGALKSLLQHHTSKASIFWCSSFFMDQLSHPYIPVVTGKTIALTRQNFVGKVMSLFWNMLSTLVIAFLPRSKRLNFMAAVTICSDFGAQENKVCQCFQCFPIYFPWNDGTGCHDLFWMLSFKPSFSLSSSTLIKKFCSSSLLSALRVLSSAYLWLLIFLLAILIPACASSSLAFCMMYSAYRASLIAQLVKNSPAMQETPVRFLGQEDPLEMEKATYSSILA